MEPTLDQALQNAVGAHKAGRIQDADRLYTTILKAQPKHPDANHNMGVLAVGVGKATEALPFFEIALEANPKAAQFWISYINALIGLDRLADAKAILDKANINGAKGHSFDHLEEKLLGVEPTMTVGSQKGNPPADHLKLLINLYNQGQLQQALSEATKLLQQFPNSIVLYNICGQVSKGLGQLDTAINSFKQAIKISPHYPEAYSNMGAVLKAQGKLEKAIEAYNKALEIKPDFAEAYSNMGNAFQEQGKLEEAIEAHTMALSIKPNYAEAYYNLGNALKEKGKPEEAIEAYNKALGIKPDYAQAYSNMGVALKGVVFKKENPAIQETMTSILDHKTYARPRDISMAVISLLKFDPSVKNACKKWSAGNLKQSFQENVLTLSELPLLLKLMSVCPINDLKLEGVLKDIRSGLLSSISELVSSTEVLRFQTALALQCFTNEYIYNQSSDETESVQSLEANVVKTLANGEQPSPQSILCLASYKALYEYEWCDLLTVTTNFEEVFVRQVIEPKYENQLKSSIPLLKEITDKVSSEVRDQYEKNPYPRWVNLGSRLEPATISKVAKEVNLRLFSSSIDKVQAPNILIAGCGTGEHSIGTAARFKNSQVLAIDLSLSSLAYAKRKTEALGIKNIEYMQADILDLIKLDRKFDIIESAGVLHHMDDPLVGWRALTECLKKGGLMGIGLYSELARQPIVKMREEIGQSGIGSSNVAMKSFRTIVMNSNKDHHKTERNSNDFYSLSTLRDLLFHVQEHRFTISQIKDCLFELGLKFCGFESETNHQNFTLTNKGENDLYDLDKWLVYEKANPRAFAGMYQFWCQK